MKKIAFLTVNFKNYEVTHEFLECLTRQTTKDFKVFIADLTPHPHPIAHDSSWTEILLSENKGYARGINIGIKHALSEGFAQFVAVNNDTRLPHDFVNNVQLSLASHPCCLIGGKIYYEKEYEYHKRYNIKDHGNVLWYAGGIIDWKNVYTLHRGVDEVDRGQYNLCQPTEFITGCLMVFDTCVVDKIGLWDERYFLYYEDADYGERAKKRGITLYYDPTLIIWHKNAQSTGGAGSSLHEKYQNKNRLIFGLKYAPFKTKLYLIKNFLFDRYLSKK